MKFIDKMSKKERKAFYNRYRGDWGNISPVTKKTKMYNGKTKTKGGYADQKNLEF